ncbi:hypothetical protein FF38_01113, partial [Lucilia cuprina]
GIQECRGDIDTKKKALPQLDLRYDSLPQKCTALNDQSLNQEILTVDVFLNMLIHKVG